LGGRTSNLGNRCGERWVTWKEGVKKEEDRLPEKQGLITEEERLLGNKVLRKPRKLHNLETRGDVSQGRWITWKPGVKKAEVKGTL
jgi:hypothetical protein